MIKLTIDSSNFSKGLNQLQDSLNELVSPSVLTEIAKAAFTITGKRFALDLDRFSVSNPKKMHHVYEWGQIGRPEGRLFVIERLGVLYGDLIIGYKFLPSRLPVPIPLELQTPGKTGKFVSSRYIFRDKADIMENGSPVVINAKKVLTFLGSEGQVFVAPGTTVTINNPGGIESKNAFAEYMIEWYTKNPNAIMASSGLYEHITNSVATALSSNQLTTGQVKKVVQGITDRVSEGLVEII